MPSSTEFDSLIQAAAANPDQSASSLERLYRLAVRQGEQESFRAALARAFSSSRRCALLDAWGYRLDVLPVEEPALADVRIQPAEIHIWTTAISMSIVSGLVWAILSAGKPPLPFPDEAAPLFWLGWAPVSALLIMGFLLSTGRDRGQRRVFVIVSAAIAALAALAWAMKESASVLTAFHLPFLVWIAVGAAATWRTQNRAPQRIGFITKSAEALVTAGIYLAGACIFGILTLGIFNILGIRFAQDWIHRCAAFALGSLPVLAVASIYNPKRPPAEQDFSTGPARLMRLLTRLLLTPVLAVLAVYVLWFIPRYFWRPFEERAVLIVYNATLAAVLLVIVLTIPHLNEEMSARWLKLLRQGIGAVCLLAFILNLYSFSAVISRTIRFGFSQNRHAVIGWNVVTLLMLGSILAGQIRAGSSDWPDRFRESFVRFLPLAALFALWVIVASPWIR